MRSMPTSASTAPTSSGSEPFRPRSSTILSARVHRHSNRLGLSYRDEGAVYSALAVGYIAQARPAAQLQQVLSQVEDAIDMA
jgi:hypothetical protein